VTAVIAGAMAAGLKVADQHQHGYDNNQYGGGQAHDDHRGIGQGDQVQPGCAHFRALYGT
jgi:hypothetical protein